MGVDTAPPDQPRLVFVDCEATGLDVAVHELLSLGYIVRDPDGSRFEIERYFAPEHLETASPEALQIIGYETRIAPMPTTPMRDALMEFAGHVAGATLVGSNPSYDERMLLAALTRLGLPTEVWHHRKVDVAAMAYDGIGRPQGLSSLCRRFGIDLSDHHGALADARATELAYDAIVAFRAEQARLAALAAQTAVSAEPRPVTSR